MGKKLLAGQKVREKMKHFSACNQAAFAKREWLNIDGNPRLFFFCIEFLLLPPGKISFN